MFVFRLNKIKILNNRERKKLFGLIKNDAEVQILSFVSTESSELPNLDLLMSVIDPAQRKTILEEMFTAVINRRILTTVENVKDGQVMTFGDTGFTVYATNTIPQQFDWLLTVIESDQKERDEAQWVSDMLSSKKFASFSNDLIGLLKTAGKGALLSNPAYLASVAIGRFAVDILLDKGKKNKDDQLGLLYMSLNRPQHYPFGKRDVQDIDDLTGNMKVDYSLFGVDDVEIIAESPKKSKKKSKKVVK